MGLMPFLHYGVLPYSKILRSIMYTQALVFVLLSSGCFSKYLSELNWCETHQVSLSYVAIHVYTSVKGNTPFRKGNKGKC